ncbi:MAG TPA: DNA methyltransferase [Polyangiaceae bacterium]|jgi:site-specific DNA-methyltransferase (adenine-specific)|nr:DNA methyltransferase [Polyangiaceae bacterium]
MKRGTARFTRGSLCFGDCLEILPKLSEQSFDLVYVDPPFNTGRPWAARVGKGERARGTAAYADRWGGIEGFLEMLAPRLTAVRPLLSAQGSLWIHLDHRAVHDTKVLADRIFGKRAYAGEVIWVPGNGARRRNTLSVTHQTILVYAPGENMIWHGDDPMVREPYADVSLKMHFSECDADGRYFRDRTIGGKTYRYYADKGRQIGSVWSDCPAMRANTPLVRESTGYPTQKPEKLLERIVRAATNADSQVLDPMCGSGTTLAVAQRLGRRFVGIDQSDVAFDVARARLKQTRATP